MNIEKIIITLLFCCLFFPHLAKGQTAVDSSQLKIANDFYQQAEAIYQADQDSAVFLIKQASIHYKKAKAWETYLSAINTLSTIYYYNDDFNGYKEYADLAVKEAMAFLPFNHDEHAMALNNQSIYYHQLGDFQKSIEALKIALKIYKQNNASSLDLALIYHNIGAYLEKKGDYPEALNYLFKAHDIRKDTLLKTSLLTKDTIPLAKIAEFKFLLHYSKQAIAWTYFKNNELEKSMSFLEPSLLAFQQLENYDKRAIRKEIISALHTITQIHKIRENYPAALKSIEEVLAYQKKEKNYRGPRSYELLGDIYLAQKKYATATIEYKKALDLTKKTSVSMDLPGHARKYASLGKVMTETTSFDEALQYYQQGLQVLAPDFTDNDFNINPPADALYSKLDALNILKGKGETLWKKYQASADQTYLKASYNTYKRGTEIIKEIRQGVITKAAKNILAENALSIYEGAINATLDLHKKTGDEALLFEAFSFAENNKSLLLLEAINEQAALGIKGLPDSLLQKEKALRLEIAFYQRKMIEADKTTTPSTNLKRWKDEVFDLNNQLLELTEYIENQFPNFYQQKYQQSKLSLEDCQKALSNSDQALIEYFLGANNLYGFVIWENGFQTFQVKNDENLLSAIHQLRTSINQPPKDQEVPSNYLTFTKNAFYLYQKILAPALHLLPQNIQALKIIPDDQLNFIPFDLLLRDEAPQEKFSFHTKNLAYVLEDYQLSYEYSATLMLKNNNSGTQNYAADFIGFAPSFKSATKQINARSCQAGDLYNLQCSKKEVETINQLLNGATHLDGAALKQTFESKANKNRIVHLATHACVDEENPLFNKIFLTDDYLSNSDLYNMQLNAELVVLSACNSGTGKLIKGEGVLSLARGFAQAGCISSIVTQWSVDDCTTSDIMINFYENLLAGQTKDQALQQAKLNHLATADQIEAHPYYWAAFVQSGNANSMEFSSNSILNYLLIGGIVLLGLFLGRRFR